jgi:hypothetical protein
VPFMYEEDLACSRYESIILNNCLAFQNVD